VRDGIFGTGFDTVATKDATSIIDVVDRRITLVHADTDFRRPRVVIGNYLDAFRRTGSGAQETSYTLLSSQFIDVQQVLTAITWLHGDWFVGILDRPFLFWNIGKGNAHPLNDGFSRFNYVSDD
jgi:hypothetical protein